MSQRRLFMSLFLLVFVIGGLVLWFLWPPPLESESTKPSLIDTRELGDLRPSMPALQDPSGSVGMPSPAGLDWVSSRPLAPRPDWNASLAFLVIDRVLQRPVTGAKITVNGPIELPPAWTDADGNARYLQLPPGTYYYQITHDRFAQPPEQSFTRLQLGPDDHQELLVELSPACLARGRVLDAANGQPLAGVHVHPHRYEDFSPALTDSEGRFEVPTGLMNGGSLYVKATGHAPQEIPFGCNGGSAELGDIALTADWTLTGRVEDTQGEPLSGVAVEDYPRGESNPSPQNLLRVLTDGEGRFTLRGLPTTNELIFFYKDGYASRSLSVNAATPPDVVVVMQPECRLEGRVLDEQDNPVANVVLQNMGGGGQLAGAISDADGRFTLTDRNPGDFSLLVTHHDNGNRRFQRVKTRCPLDEPLIVQVESADDSRIEGVVLDSEEHPVEGATLILRPLGGNQEGMGGFRETRSETDGHFSLGAHTGQTYSIIAFTHQPQRHGSLNKLEAPARDLKLVLTDFARTSKFPAQGTVAEQDGTLITDFRYCWGVCQSWRSPDSDGHWENRFGEMTMDFPPLWITLEDGRMGRWNGRSSGTDAPVVIIGDGSAVSGRLSADFPGGLTKVELSYIGVISSELVEDGFHFPLVPPGIYTLILTASDGRRLEMKGLRVQTDTPLDLGELKLP